MNIGTIEREIEKLENGRTTYDSCMRLSHLYNVRDHMNREEYDREGINGGREYDNYSGDRRRYGEYSGGDIGYKNGENQRGNIRCMNKSDESMSGNSEFMRAVRNANIERALIALDKYMSRLKMNKPLEYQKIMETLYDLH